MKKSTKIIALLIVMIGMFTSSCKKFEMDEFVPKDPDNPTTVTLMGSVDDGTKKVMGQVLTSNSTINGDLDFYFGFWLEPSTSTPIATGTYVIKNSSNVTVYSSTAPENGIDFKFPATGTYILSVSGTYNGTPFSFVNINIIVTDGTVPINPATSPVRIVGMSTNSTTTSISLAVSRAEYATITATNWFYVAKINGTNFTHVAATFANDSVYFSIPFSTASGTTNVEFNAGYEDGSVGGIWFTASLPTGSPSILYPGTGNFWKIVINNNGSTIVATAPNGTVLLTIPVSGTAMIPGNNGDDLAHGNTVRWSGLTHFLKYSGSNFYCEYKIGTGGTWTPISGTLFAGNTDYYQINFPGGTSGELHFRYGAMVGSNFTPAPNMPNSMFYVGGELIRNV